MARTIRNWDKTLAWTPSVVHEPTTTAEVCAIIAAAAERGQRIKAIGSALSWSDIAGIPEQVMVLDKMTGIRVDSEARRVRVQAGAKLKDVNDALSEYGLSLENFGSITMQTAGGYTGTGTHGTGRDAQILSAHIESMELVDGVGNPHHLDSENEPDLFAAARVHLGALGVVTEITFRCVRAFDLEERLEIVDFDKALADLDGYVNGNDYCKLWWLPYSDQIQVYTFNKTTEPRTPITIQERFDATGLSGVTFGGLLGLSRLRPRVTPWLLPTVEKRAFRSHRRVDRGDRIIKYAGTIPWHQETEYAIPREHAADGIAAMRNLVVTATGYRVNFTQEVRFVAKDDIPMSPAFGRDSCYLGGYVASLKWAPRYFLDFEALMAKFDGRPHWGKSFDRTAEELRALYPRYDAFNELRQRCDPRGVFRNRFVDRVFPPEE